MSNLDLLLLLIFAVLFLLLIELSAFRSQVAARNNKEIEDNIIDEMNFYDPPGFRKPGRYIDGEYYAHGKYPKAGKYDLILGYCVLSVFILAITAKMLGFH